MKKTILLGIVAIASTSSNAEAFMSNSASTSGIYIELFGGANFLQTSSNNHIQPTFETGYIVSGSLGYKWCNGLRLEAEYAFRRNDLEKLHFFGQTFKLPGHFQSSSYMANALWDISLSRYCINWLTPFAGVGIGYDTQQYHAKQDGFHFRRKENSFAWQLMTGLKLPIFKNTDLSLEYKFHKGPIKNIYSHSIGLGLTYTFGCGSLMTF